MYGLKTAGMDHVTFAPVPVLMVVKIIWNTMLKTIYIQTQALRS